MPRLVGKDGQQMDTHKLAGNFSFTGARVSNLGATEYTLVSIFTDVSGSVSGFESDLRDMEVASVEACRKSPRSDNVLVRLVRFSSMFPQGISEVHGFQSLHSIDTATYPAIHAGGGTPLCDACYSGIGALNAYGKQLTDQDYLVNGISFFITDGEENMSTATMKMVQDEARKSVTGEVLESHISVLIGINAGGSASALSRFQTEAGITQFINAGDVTKGKLAKLAHFVSNSVSSTSQALGTGGPSQNIATTI